MSKLWQDEELQILEALRSTCSTIEIQTVLYSSGFTRTLEAIAKKARKNRWYFVDYSSPLTNNLTATATAAVRTLLEARNEGEDRPSPEVPSTSSAKGRKTMKMNEELSVLHRELEEIRLKVPRTSSKASYVAADSMSLVLALSDFHVGKTIRDEHGTTTYNAEIGCRRIEDTPELAWSYLTADQQKNISEVVVLLMGDHVDGEGIYPGHDLTLDKGVPTQVKMVTEATWKMLQDIRSRVPLVRVVTVKGNHGRSGQNPESNFDNMYFWGLEILADMHADPGLVIKNRFGDYNIFTAQGYRGLIRHKAPVQADTAGGAKTFIAWKDMHNLDMVAYGHYHHWGAFTHNGLFILRNGSLPGGDDYAEGFGAWDAPTQMMFGVTADELPTFITALKYE